MASNTSKDISEHIMGEEWCCWEVPDRLDGRVIAFEEALPIIIKEDPIWGPIMEGRYHEESGQCAGALRYRRMMRATHAYSDIAYKCGSCHRVIIGRPELIADASPDIKDKGGAEYRCRSCRAPIYALLPEDFGYEL